MIVLRALQAKGFPGLVARAVMATCLFARGGPSGFQGFWAQFQPKSLNRHTLGRIVALVQKTRASALPTPGPRKFVPERIGSRRGPIDHPLR